MKYEQDIVKQITEELQKIPNIRYVCNKFGIHHSTYYRWVVLHFKFHQAVVGALAIGREQMNDAAESVIISGIQNGDIKAAIHYLSHNHERYIRTERVRYYQYLDKENLKFMKKEIPDESQFENLLKYYMLLEDVYPKKKAKTIIDPLIKITCHGDEELETIFYSVYEESKKSKTSYAEKQLQLNLKPLSDEEEEIDEEG